jgi:uncharacterized protein YndB with AHSA1/START domain
VIEPLRLAFEVRCPPEQAFAVWTGQISRWWPTDHSYSGEEGITVVLEGRRGGRIFERTRAGDEFAWGEVTLWEPPRRLGYLWHLRRDRADATQVQITFVDQGDATTRVEIEHTGWERLGAQGPGWRDANRAGWSSLLPHYVAAAETQ